MGDIATITIDYENGHVAVDNPLADVTNPWRPENLSYAALIAGLLGPEIIKLMKLPKEDLQRMNAERLRNIASRM